MKLADGAATAPVLGLQFRTLATPSFGDVSQLSSTTQELPARRGCSSVARRSEFNWRRKIHEQT